MTLAPMFTPTRLADSQMLKILNTLESVRAEWRLGDLGLDSCERYHTGKQPLRYMSDDLQKDLGGEVTQLVINWPALVAEAYAERLVPTGFNYPSGGRSADGQQSAAAAVSADTLWQWWQANNMDEQANMAQLDAIALGKAALLVGPGSDVPVMTAESAFDVAWTRDPKSGRVVQGMKAWRDEERREWRTLYLPGRRVVLVRGDFGWAVDQDAESSEEVPLVPLVNRPRLRQRDGRTEFADIIPLADAANKMATDMMVSGEYHAMPRRWVFGLSASDFKNADGTMKNVWSVIKGRLWATSSKPGDVEVGQFNESSLTNFHETIKLLARLTAQMSGLPSDYMSFESVNPPSADSLRAAERRMVKKCEDQQVSFSGAYEEAMRHAIRFARGKYEPSALMLETTWRDPGTPTTAQVTDAVVKAHQSGVLSREGSWDEMGWSEARKAKERAYFAAEAIDPLAAVLAKPLVTDAAAGNG